MCILCEGVYVEEVCMEEGVGGGMYVDMGERVYVDEGERVDEGESSNYVVCDTVRRRRN